MHTKPKNDLIENQQPKVTSRIDAEQRGLTCNANTIASGEYDLSRIIREKLREWDYHWEY